MYSVTPALSLTGLVFGMHATAVKPPATAAAVPVATVSLVLLPGSRRCTCMSMRPGHTTKPLGTSTTSTSRSTGKIAPDARDRVAVDRARRTRRRARSPDRRRALAPSTATPTSSTLVTRLTYFKPSRIRGVPCRRLRSTSVDRAAGEQIQHGHADRDAVGDLLEDDRSTARRRRPTRSRRRGSSGPGA